MRAVANLLIALDKNFFGIRLTAWDCLMQSLKKISGFVLHWITCFIIPDGRIPSPSNEAQASLKLFVSLIDFLKTSISFWICVCLVTNEMSPGSNAHRHEGFGVDG